MSSFKYIKAEYNPDRQRLDVDPAFLVLDATTDHVVWWCVGLPEDGQLEVVFDGESPTGPFVELRSQDGLVIGSGNVGPKLENAYPYTIRATAPGIDWYGQAEIKNLSWWAKTDFVGATCVRPESGPPRCENPGPTM
jgi:hypothetical protein